MVGTLLLAFTQTPHLRAQEATPYGQADQETYIQIIDLQGRVLHNLVDQPTTASRKIDLSQSLHSLLPGIYFIRIQQGEIHANTTLHIR